jgi:glyoxylase-like metal-dependent hydrolase (beta-lactamase superfamily II)
MKIIPLSEGSFTIDKTKLFVPFNESTDNLQHRPVGSLLVEIQPFVVITTKDVLLLDTGLGFNDSGNGQMQIHANMERNGIDPEQVTKVLLSHLHKDHAGGISFPNEHSRLSFPNATYYIQRRELEFAREKGFPSYVMEDLNALEESDKVIFLNEIDGSINGYIHYHVTGAHSPHHQVFWIREGSETIFFGGDVAPQLQQMRIRYKTKYDFDPEKAMHLRRQWWEQGNKESWKFLFYHDIKTPIYNAG